MKTNGFCVKRACGELNIACKAYYECEIALNKLYAILNILARCVMENNKLLTILSYSKCPIQFHAILIDFKFKSI